MKKLGDSAKNMFGTIASNKFLMYGVVAIVLLIVAKKVFKKGNKPSKKESAENSNERLLNTEVEKLEKVTHNDNEFKKYAIQLEDAAKGWFLGYGENDRKMRRIFGEAINNLADLKRFNVIYNQVNARSVIDMIYQEHKHQKYINAYNLLLMKKEINFTF